MPARPAPRISTLLPFFAPASWGGPLKFDSAAKPSDVIAWYMAPPPAALPIMFSKSRRVNAGVFSWVIGKALAPALSGTVGRDEQ